MKTLINGAIIEKPMAIETGTLISIILALIIISIISYLAGKKLGKLQAEKELEPRLVEERGDAIKRSRAVLSGQFSEQLAPYLPNFPYKPTEARFIGKPVDFIVFKGMDEKDINEVVFVEVKTGTSTLSTHERKLRDVINNKKVKWELYSPPEQSSAKK